MFVSRARRLLAASALVTLIGLPLAAQTKYLVSEPGTWKPWKFTAIASARQQWAASPADVTAFEARLVELNAILKRAAGVAPPVGFSVETWGHLGSYTAPTPEQPPGRNLPLAGGLDFGAFAIVEYQRGGKTVRTDTGETPLLLFNVNELQPWLVAGNAGKPQEWADLDTDAFLQPAPGPAIAGLPRYADMLILKKNPASIWAPVTIEAALKLVIAANEGRLKSSRDSLAAMQKSSDDWRNPAKRAERVAGYKTVATTQPNPAAFVAKMDQFEKEHETQLATEAGPDGPTAKAIRAVEQENAAIVESLAAMTPADRASASCYAKGAATTRRRFTIGPSTACVPLVRPNWQYFNASLPRSAPQLVVITGYSRCLDDRSPPTNPAGCAANTRLLETLDKDAVLAWLR